MSSDFTPYEAGDATEILSRENHAIRLGTPIEFLLYRKKHNPPGSALCLGKSHNGKFLRWFDWVCKGEYRLGVWDKPWPKYFKVFIVKCL